ncbi:MAG: hypothetical protein ACXWE3_13255 [Methylobacter sp.]
MNVCNFESNQWGQTSGIATGILIPGNYVGVNDNTNLSSSIVFGNGGYVASIYLWNTLGDTYELQIVATGPTGWDNSGHLSFTDAGGSSYSIGIYNAIPETHILTYTSENPNIVTINWSE